MKKFLLATAVLAVFGIAGVVAAKEVASFGAPFQCDPEELVSRPGTFTVRVVPEKYAKMDIYEIYENREVTAMPDAPPSFNQIVEQNDWYLSTNTPVTLSLRSEGFENIKNGQDAPIMDKSIIYYVPVRGGEVYDKDSYARVAAPNGSSLWMDPRTTWTLDTANSFGTIYGWFDANFSRDNYVGLSAGMNNVVGDGWTDILAGVSVTDTIVAMITE